MPYVRITLLSPRPGTEDEIQVLQRKLITFFAAQAGYKDGYLLHADGRLGRLTVWDSETAADLVANHDHVLALRSPLLYLLASDDELAFQGEQVRA